MPRDFLQLQSSLHSSLRSLPILAGGRNDSFLWSARAEAIRKVISSRLQKSSKERPFGYLVRHAPTDDVRQLQQLTGHLQAGLFVTKFRKLFTRDEMAEDLVIVPARLGEHEDNSEYEEILPTSPP